MRRCSLGYFRYLWSVRKDFSKWHLLRCIVYDWRPLPDRIFNPSPMFSEEFLKKIRESKRKDLPNWEESGYSPEDWED